MKRNMRFGISVLLVAMLLLSMAFVPAVSAKKDKGEGDVGILSIDVNGGYLTVDEGAGTVVIAKAYGASPDIDPGTPIRIGVYYDYIDTADYYGGSVQFKLTAPDGGVATKDITDNLAVNDNTDGYLYKTFIANPGETYYFTVSASRTGVPSAQDIGKITPI